MTPPLCLVVFFYYFVTYGALTKRTRTQTHSRSFNKSILCNPHRTQHNKVIRYDIYSILLFAVCYDGTQKCDCMRWGITNRHKQQNIKKDKIIIPDTVQQERAERKKEINKAGYCKEMWCECVCSSYYEQALMNIHDLFTIVTQGTRNCGMRSISGIEKRIGRRRDCSLNRRYKR